MKTQQLLAWHRRPGVVLLLLLFLLDSGEVQAFLSDYSPTGHLTASIMLSMLFICSLHLQQRWSLFRKHVGISSRPSGYPPSATSQRERQGYVDPLTRCVFLPNVFQSYRLSWTHHLVCLFWQQHRSFVSWHVLRHEQAHIYSDSSEKNKKTKKHQEAAQSCLEEKEKLENIPLYFMHLKMMPNTVKLNILAINLEPRREYMLQDSFRSRVNLMSLKFKCT